MIDIHNPEAGRLHESGYNHRTQKNTTNTTITQQTQDTNNEYEKLYQTTLNENYQQPPSNNTACGDTIQHKEQNTLQILFINTNGLSTKHKFSDLEEICTAQQHYKVDILCLAETNINWGTNNNNEKARNIVRKYNRHSRLATTHIPSQLST